MIVTSFVWGSYDVLEMIQNNIFKTEKSIQTKTYVNGLMCSILLSIRPLLVWSQLINLATNF